MRTKFVSSNAFTALQFQKNYLYSVFYMQAKATKMKAFIAPKLIPAARNRQDIQKKNFLSKF